MVRAAVCQPLATSPPKKVPAAAFSSVWNGCGSYCDAKALIVSAVSVTDADLNFCPTARSSQYRSSAIVCSLKFPHARTPAFQSGSYRSVAAPTTKHIRGALIGCIGQAGVHPRKMDASVEKDAG